MRLELGLEPVEHVRLRVVPLDLEHLAQQLSPDEVRRLAGYHFARRAQDGHAVAELAGLGQQTRLPDAGLAYQLDQRSRAAPRGSDRLA